EFSEALERYIRPNDTIWIADHRLLPLAAQVRKRMPEISVGCFVSVEFPGYEAMKRMPRHRQEEVLKGILGADLVAFQRERDRDNFLQCVQLLLGIDSEERTIRIEERDKGWLRDSLSALRTSKARQAHFRVRFFDVHSRNGLLDRYRSAPKRLFLLDYDGTLTPFFNLPALAKPDNLLLDILDKIARNPRNSVYIVSGRDSRTLDNWLGHLPVNIIAEHGARVRYHQGQWEERAMPAVKWQTEVERVMQGYLEKCLHSFIEHKDFSIVWHYRNSPPEQVAEVKMEMYAALCRIAEEQKLQVMLGNKIIEVRNRGTDKGTAIQHVLSQEERDFILAIGDDRTDEDMFRMLTETDNAFTIKVGVEASFAQFNMHTPQMVISLLGNMVFLEGQGAR
ncbi:MAG TPA: trehalose-phosphatase, partial [Puia sp.]|nr:trehalose-phosphatase [Puia sp.]